MVLVQFFCNSFILHAQVSEEAMEEIFGYDDAEMSKRRKMSCSSVFCDPRRRGYRFIILTFLFLAYICVFFTVELPSGLQTVLLEVMDINAKEYNLLFSIFTWPDVVLSLFGGIIMDRFIGLRAGIVLVAAVSLTGEVIFAIGGFMSSYPIALLGRVVFGCGIGIYKNALFIFIALWFKGKEINFVTASSVCFARTGTSLGLLVPEIFYNKLEHLHESNSFRVGASFCLGVTALALGLLCCIIVVILDKRGAKLLHRKPSESVEFKMTDFKDFSPSFWLASLPQALFYSVLYSYAANGQFFVISKYGINRSKANIANALIFIAPILVTPLFGLLLDLCGYNILWGMLGAFIGVLAHVVYATSAADAFIPYIGGITYSLSYTVLVTAIYPMPVFIVRCHQLATAYSFYNVQYCILFSLVSVVAGYVIDHFGFLILEVYFALLMVVAFCSLLMLLMITLANGSTKLLKADRGTSTDSEDDDSDY